MTIRFILAMTLGILLTFLASTLNAQDGGATTGIHETVMDYNRVSRQIVHKFVSDSLIDMRQTGQEDQAALLALICVQFLHSIDRDFDWGWATTADIDGLDATLLELAARERRGDFDASKYSGTAIDRTVSTFCPGIGIDQEINQEYPDLDYTFAYIELIYSDFIMQGPENRTDLGNAYIILLLTEMYLRLEPNTFNYIFDKRFLPIFFTHYEEASARGFATVFDKLIVLIGQIQSER